MEDIKELKIYIGLMKVQRNELLKNIFNESNFKLSDETTAADNLDKTISHMIDERALEVEQMVEEMR
jgi:hypothetical protein